MDRRLFLLSVLAPSAAQAGVVFHESPIVPVFAEVSKKKPQVWMFSTCESCRVQAMSEIASEKDSLDFEVVHKNEKPPSRLDVYDDPTFWWAKDVDQPDQSNQNTKVFGGWNGLKFLKDEFKKSREQPKKTKQAGSPASPRPFEQSRSAPPDQQNSRAVARNSAVYHAGHNCPNCSRVQFNILNDSGPNHTHRCGSCHTVWFHKDRV